MAKILLVEDNTALADSLKEWFDSEGHLLEHAETGEDALQLLRNFKYDVILLDWSLPGISGLDVCKQFRKEGGVSHIIFLTGQGEIERREEGLDGGADDYLVKPFDVRELSARVRSLLRRPPGLLPSELKIGAVSLNPQTRTMLVGDNEVRLMPKECALLEYLMRHPNTASGSKVLLESVWPSDSEASTETVRTWMKNLRQKLTAAGQADFIKTAPGSGYFIEFTS